MATKKVSLIEAVQYLLSINDNQTDLAKRIKVYQSTISKLNQGIEMPKISYETGMAIMNEYYKQKGRKK